MQPSP
jgi:hypothetical protein